MTSSSSSPAQPRPPPQQRRVPKMPSPPSPPSPPLPSSSSTSPSSTSARSSPYLPTPRETLLLSVFPALLVFGTVFSALSPQTRAAAAALPPDAAVGTAHFAQTAAAAPSYFARKDNVLNVFFVKRGWFWISLAFGLFVGTHPVFGARPSPHAKLGRRATAVLRWALVTGWWFLVTQWFFGPALIDRSFRMTGGACEALQAAALDEQGTVLGAAAAAATAAACKRAGGQWRGGHDISGHVFLLVLGTSFLAQEIGWVLWRQVRYAAGPAAGTASTANRRFVDARSLVMGDGAVKSAEVEASSSRSGSVDTPTGAGSGFGASSSSSLPMTSRLALRVAAGVVGLCLWMLLMTAIYFHTWLEKLTGLLVALIGFYAVYVVPRFVPAVRQVVGVPGI